MVLYIKSKQVNIVHSSENVSVFQSVLFKTNAGILQINDSVLVVDPNWLPGEVEFLAGLVFKKIKKRNIYLFFTHSDYDHIIGYKAFPGAKTIASKSFNENPDKQNVLSQIVKFDHDYYLDRLYPTEYPPVDYVLEDAEGGILLDNIPLKYLQAPGHNPDGAMLCIDQLEIVILGDYLSDVEFPFVYHSFKKYLKTINNLKTWVKGKEHYLFIPGHGSPFSGKEAFEKRLEESLTYLEEVKDQVLKNIPFDEEKLWKRYKYRQNQQVFHQENIKLAAKEYLSKTT